MKTTVKGEIDRFEAVYTGHGIPRDMLCAWLEDVDGYVAREILLTPDIPLDYSYEKSPDTELLVSEPPYRRVYYTYLSAMADFVMKQFNTYSSELSEYNGTMRDYRHYILSIRPIIEKRRAEV